MTQNKFKPKGSLIAALDIGSHKIACLIGRTVDDQGGIEILGAGFQASKGLKGGTVIDLAAAESTIRQTVNIAENLAAEAMKGYPLRDVIINVPGVHTRSHLLSVDVQIHGHEITDNDVRRALSKAQDQVLSADHELIHTIPVDYRIDGHEGIRDPRGMVGRGLEVGIHMVTADVGPLENFAESIERSHLDVESLCASGYAAGLACLKEDAIDLGAIVIDMGAGVTSIAVFQGGHMVFSDHVPLGGQHVTNDIAQMMTCSISDAERLKTLHGSALISASDEDQMIDVPQIGQIDKHHPNMVPRSKLNEAIKFRLEEIFEMVRGRLKEAGFYNISRQVILTGGASQMQNIVQLAETTLDKTVNLGRPIRIYSLPDAMSGPAFATTAGLLVYLTQRQDEMPAEIMASVTPGTLWERVKYWWKENW